MYDHIPYSDLWFFPKLCAFNIAWRAVPNLAISSYITTRGNLLKSVPSLEERQARYADFPAFRGITYP